jgi:hypothetical protein
LLLHDLAELLELRIVSEELEVPEALLLASLGGGSCSRATTAAGAGAAALLGGEVEQVDISIIVTASAGGRSGLTGRSGGLLEMLGNALTNNQSWGLEVGESRFWGRDIHSRDTPQHGRGC